jgi:hypothetical protein
MKKIIFLICFFIFSACITAQTLQPTANLALLQGTVTNMKGKRLANEIIMFENNKTKSVIQTTTNALGKFEMLAPVNTLYNLKYKNFTLDMSYTKCRFHQIRMPSMKWI